jgi:hypothetical protein
MTNWNEQDHPRDPAGKDTGGQFVSKAETAARKAAGLGKVGFHGTSLLEAERIRFEGLKKSKASIGDRPESVYFMENERFTRDYVADLYMDQDAGFATVEFSIPEDFTGEIKIDEEEGDSFRIERDIPAEWVRKIRYYDKKGRLFKET